ncbi:MAG TPA: hypothetical protein DHW63_07175 [Hyphomonadaceae bacterium]|nr:hypothetical protein [Hyphomonadaceae bacterium]
MKRIVICMDGTWQNLAWQTIDRDKVTGWPLDRRTNVAKVAQQTANADDKGVQQLVYYSPGVGARTFASKDQKVANYEGATGEGSEENIIAAYLFLSFNYELGDEIYLFGFSRGAFGVRSLAGLVRRCGILKRTETAQVRNALGLYRERDQDKYDLKASQFRKLNSVAPIAGQEDVGLDDPGAVRVTYIGVFDTVVMRKSIAEIAGLAQPDPEHKFHDLKLGNHVMSARQAIAIDERRNTLPLTPWSNIGDFCALKGCDPCSPDAPYQQKWFAGSHGDVGGGASRELSSVSRKWVLRGAAQCGLKFNETLRTEGGPSSPAFLLGGIEKLDSLGILGYADRVVYPEAPDPTERREKRPRIAPTLMHLDRHVHVSAVIRMLTEKKYRPSPLRAFKQLIDPQDKAFRDWLARRTHEMFA